MKILQVLPELNIGGVERGTVDLARQLMQQGHQALVVSNGGRLVKELQATGARHIKLAVHQKSPFSILVNVPKLAGILRQEKIDIVHARSRVPALIAFLACRRAGVNFVTTCHGYYSRNLFSRIMGWGKRVIVSSAAIARHMTADFGVPPERIRLIPRGVDLSEFKFVQRPRTQDRRPDTFTIGVIGRLTPIKGHKYFLQALARVVREVPKVRALIAGEAPGKEKYKEELLMFTRRLSLDRYVEFLGPQDNIPGLLTRLDLLVLPTVTQEAFGRVLIEAGACGVPVVATQVGGVIDIIEDEVDGLLVAPKDPAGLASAMLRIYKDPAFARKLALAAQKNVEQNFTLQQMARKTIAVYREVLASLRILVIKLSALGDVILATASLRALRKKFPQAYIAVLVAQAHRAVLENCPDIDRIIEFPSSGKDFKNIWQLSAELRRLNFEQIVDLQNNRRSHWLAYLSAGNSRYGYANGKFSFLLNKKIKDLNRPLSPIKHQARILKMLGIAAVKEDLQLWPKRGDRDWAANFLKRHRKDRRRPLIGINLGAAAAWPTKRWKIEKLAILLHKLRELKTEILLTGSSQDKGLVQRLKAAVQDDFIDSVGQVQIMQLACLIERCNVYVSSDSAPLHIAYAMKTPVVALFGPTDPRRHALEQCRQAIIKEDIECSPCYKRRCCRKPSCMDEISPEKVLEAVRRLLR